MDPLSIAGAIVGIVASASKMIPMLTSFVNNVKDAPKLAREVLAELLEITAFVRSLQMFINKTPDSERQNEYLIQIDDLVLIMTGCVLTYSELEQTMDSLGLESDTKKFNRTKWMWHQSSIQRILGRLQSYKRTLSVMLEILQWYVKRDVLSLELLLSIFKQLSTRPP